MSYKEVKFMDGSYRRIWINVSNEHHRELGPAAIWYYPDGSIERECFYIDGKFHRELGPAAIWYYPDGSIEIERFYLNGEYLGPNNIGFWVLWDKLTDDKRRSPEILKCLARFS
jgi:hypothetical protein